MPRALTVSEAAARRRSIRQYEPGPIPRADLDAILDVARLAPSMFNLQPWRFVVVERAETKAALAEAAHGQRQVASAPAVIVLYTNTADALSSIDEVIHPSLDAERRVRARASVDAFFAPLTPADREHWGRQQGYIALGYLLLAAEEQGYQTSPMLGFDADRVRDAIGLPGHVPIPALVAIGRGTEDGRPSHRLPGSRTVRYV